jgi:predicted RNA-binding Zn-ribbon protein involved in translation (DUF1610 family)
MKDKNVKKCVYVLRDTGTMGFQDLEYHTKCGKRIDYDNYGRFIFCPYCGHKIEIK